jgi:hypothetical protein
VIGRNLPGFDVRFDFHFSFSIWMLTLNDKAVASASRLAVIIAHMYRRKREAELLARWKCFLRVRKPGL